MYIHCKYLCTHLYVVHLVVTVEMTLIIISLGYISAGLGYWTRPPCEAHEDSVF